jgi:hypothetical protein
LSIVSTASPLRKHTLTYLKWYLILHYPPTMRRKGNYQSLPLCTM